MAAVSIRGLDASVKERLRVRAAERGHSMEAEIRDILTATVSDDAGPGLGQAWLTRFAEVGGVELSLPSRSEPARAADLGS